MSASSSSVQTVLQNPSSQPVLQKPPVIHIVMYNAGIQKTQVHTEALYKKKISSKLKADVTAAILEQEADIIQLCELGRIEDGIEETLDPTTSKCNKTDSAANTDSVEKPVHAVELWNVHCSATRK